ncbi:hypothetical protein F2Q69_00043313 [Brassica cretica]|uniref:Uncharacterized protein n=1 Tax=Brassica cretica TaxID=69181 RepID=A0A8S9NK71_BRACR|nr:hypothetical protein F2Q69_00043313 [Brassica cretica]
MAELDKFSAADGELDRTCNQLGNPPSRTSPVRRMAELERSCCLHPVLAARPSGLERTCSCFILIRVTVRTRFKDRKNSFSRITFGLIV